MMLGKRARPPMKRTTSMTEFTLNLNASDPHNPFTGGVDQHYLAAAAAAAAAAPPRAQRRNSADFVPTASFLRACSFCKRLLIPGRDIFMYRGDSAFCSLECRQQQITEDERKEKCSLMASKKETSSAAAAAAAKAKVPGTVERVSRRID